MLSLKSPDSLHKNAKYISYFLTCILLFLIATFRLKKNLNQVIHFYYSASIFHTRKSKKFLLSRTIARDIDSLMVINVFTDVKHSGNFILQFKKIAGVR